MAKIVRYNGNLQAFASAAPGTERTIFGDITQADDLTSQITADFLRGWGIVGPSDQPALEDFNGAMYTHGQILAYLHQMGVAEYNSTQEYPIDGMCNFGGAIYASLINVNIGNTPSSSPLQWRPLSSGRLLGVQIFTSNGTYTPTPGMGRVIIRCQGGGGGGGGTAAPAVGTVSIGAGGAAGAYAEGLFLAAAIGASQPVTIGGGGIVAVANNGAAGGTSSVGALIVSPGGPGGLMFNSAAVPNAQGNGATSGTPTGGNITSSVGTGGPLGLGLTTLVVFGGAGGSSIMGSGAPNSPSGGGGGSPGQGFGGGGSGAATVSGGGALPGGAGKGGTVIIMEYT